MPENTSEFRVKSHFHVKTMAVDISSGWTYQISNDVKSQVIEPMQTVHIIPLLPLFASSFASAVPLVDQFRERMLDIRLELCNALRTERVRHRLPLPRMLSSIAGVEQTSLD